VARQGAENVDRASGGTVLVLSRKKLNTFLFYPGNPALFQQDATYCIGNSAAKRHEVIAFGINNL
jgi:hypothetical protein